MTREDDRDIGVASTLDREIAPFVVRARPLLRSGPFCLWGEIVSIQHGDRTTFLTLVDAHDVTRRIDARLASPATPIALGEMVGLWGRLVPTQPGPSSIDIVFAADRLEATRGPSRRQRERRALVSRYAHVRRARPRRPRRIALVTSARSRAIADFQRALAGDGEPPVQVTLFAVALNDPASIAQGITLAHEARPDLIVVTRGGGDPASFLAFREPSVIQVVGTVVSVTPTVVAIGHAEDTLELDELATWTVSTPAAAGALVRRLALWPERGRSWTTLVATLIVAGLVAWLVYRYLARPSRPPLPPTRPAAERVVQPKRAAP